MKNRKSMKKEDGGGGAEAAAAEKGSKCTHCAITMARVGRRGRRRG